jgi:two-component system, chemotaxis family, CheB/CheR fusion protein
VDFENYKKTSIKRRIEKHLGLLKLNTLEEMEEYLKNNPDEVDKLYEEMLIGVTSFF